MTDLDSRAGGPDIEALLHRVIEIIEGTRTLPTIETRMRSVYSNPASLRAL